MSRNTDYILELGGKLIPVNSTADTDATEVANSFQGRPWISVQWKCCSAYSRIYRNASGTFYRGACPKCGRPVQVKVGSGGTNNRFFEAY